MKKIFTIILSALILASCGGNDTHKLEGTWKLTSIVVDAVDYTHGSRMQEYYPDIDQSTIVFEGDNQFVITQVCMRATGDIPEFSYEFRGTYSYIDGIYQFVITENTKDTEENYTITGTLKDNELTLKKHFDAMEMWIVGNENPVDAYVTFEKK